MKRLSFLYIFVCFILLMSCKKDVITTDVGNYNDSLSHSHWDDSLIGSKWVITRYDDGQIPYYPNDTINFVDNQEYKINSNGSLNRYDAYRVRVGNGFYNISIYLYSISTLGGSYGGQVPENSFRNGIINNVTMTDLYNNNSVKIWIKRI